MTIKRIAAGFTATAAITAGLVLATSPTAHAADCYEAGLDHSPSASVQLFPPQVSVDDGDPYVRYDPNCFVQD